MNSNEHNSLSESAIERRLEELKQVPQRDALQAASGRARFLREAAGYQQAVSPATRVRQMGWIFKIRKEKLSMNALVSLILAVSLLLGGGATVAAAQDDLPTQSLYQLKLWTENAKLAIAGEPQEQADLLMTMTQTRLQEMTELAELGLTPPDQVREQLQLHLDQILTLAATMDEATREQTLLQLRDCLQTQDHLMEQLQIHASAESEPILARTRLMLQTHLHLLDQGLVDPQGFQYKMNNQMQNGQEEEATSEPNQQGEPGFHQNGPEEQPNGEPGTGNGSGEGNDSPGGPNPDKPQTGSGANASGENGVGSQNPENPQGGNGPDEGNDGGGGQDGGNGSGNSPGGGGGNK